MSIKASEISDLIGQRIQNFAGGTEARNVGSVMSVADGVVRIHGLADVRYGEMIEFPGNVFGLALNLEQDSVGAVVLGEYKSIKEGDTVKTTGRILEVPVGPELLGRVVDALVQSSAWRRASSIARACRSRCRLDTSRWTRWSPWAAASAS
jgi:F-type H+/Na+-transporting ATPase subunit alpha